MAHRVWRGMAWTLGVGLAAFWAGPAGAISDPRDRTAMQQALNDLMGFAAPGRSVRWENPVTGNSGEVIALQPFSSGGAACWEYERTYEEAGRIQVVEGTACELVAGLWQITNEGPPRDRDAPAAEPTLEPEPEPEPEPARVASPSYDRALVRESQAHLSRLGYKPGPVDGAYGPRTRAALTAYQMDQGFEPTGEPSMAVLDSLRERVAALPPETKKLPKSSIPSATPEDAGSDTVVRKSPPPSEPGPPASVATPSPEPTPAPAPAPAPGATPSLPSSSGDIAVPPPPPPPE